MFMTKLYYSIFKIYLETNYFPLVPLRSRWSRPLPTPAWSLQYRLITGLPASTLTLLQAITELKKYNSSCCVKADDVILAQNFQWFFSPLE